MAEEKKNNNKEKKVEEKEKVVEETEKAETAETKGAAEVTEVTEVVEAEEASEIIGSEKVEEAHAEEESAKEARAEEASKETKKQPFSGNVLAITLSAVAIVLSGTSAVFSWLSYEKANTPLTILTPSGGVDGNTTGFTSGTVADVVEKVSESVVSIVTSATASNYFGQPVSSSAAGTGIIVSEDGYILTNKHVINGATKISVVLDNGKTYDGVKVAATDPLNDIAFLKIDGVSDLKAATLGDSKTITAGQQVVAIGNALGQYQNSVTSGIVSGTGRSLTATDATGSMSETLTDMIQTDAAINSGNSGGPLVNASGQVIGVNTATSTSADNIGFAIPIASVKGMLKQLMSSGSTKRSYLGVYLIAINSDVAKEYNLPVTEGAYVFNATTYSAIIPDSPAAKAGVRDKDIIVAVNGVKVGAAGSLSTLVGEYQPGDTVQLTVLREGKEIAINVTLEGYEQ